MIGKFGYKGMLQSSPRGLRFVSNVHEYARFLPPINIYVHQSTLAIKPFFDLERYKHR